MRVEVNLLVVGWRRAIVGAPIYQKKTRVDLKREALTLATVLQLLDHSGVQVEQRVKPDGGLARRRRVDFRHALPHVVEDAGNRRVEPGWRRRHR